MASPEIYLAFAPTKKNDPRPNFFLILCRWCYNIFISYKKCQFVVSPINHLIFDCWVAGRDVLRRILRPNYRNTKLLVAFDAGCFGGHAKLFPGTPSTRILEKLGGPKNCIFGVGSLQEPYLLNDLCVVLIDIKPHSIAQVTGAGRIVQV